MVTESHLAAIRASSQGQEPRGQQTTRRAPITISLKITKQPRRHQLAWRPTSGQEGIECRMSKAPRSQERRKRPPRAKRELSSQKGVGLPMASNIPGRDER